MKALIKYFHHSPDDTRISAISKTLSGLLVKRNIVVVKVKDVLKHSFERVFT